MWTLYMEGGHYNANSYKIIMASFGFCHEHWTLFKFTMYVGL